MAGSKIGNQVNTGYVQDYSNIRVPKTHEAPVQTGHQAPQNDNLSFNQDLKESTNAQVARKDTPIEELSIGFNTKDSSMVGFGGNFNLATSDMRQAISAMQKDQVLHQYQYFVGSSQDIQSNSTDNTSQNNIVYNGEEGIVYRK